MGVRAAPLLAALALLAVGCGGGGGGNALPAAADVVPASAPALIAVNTDFSSAQWKRELALVRKFPGADDLLRQASSEAGNVDFEHDVKPALGPEVDVVWLDFRNGGNDLVALTQPKDEKRFAALIEKGNSTGNSDLVTIKVGDWTVAADSRRKLERFRRAASSGEELAEDEAFQDAMGELDETSAVRAYVAGPPVQRALDRALESGGAAPRLTRGVAEMQSISAAALVEREGIRADAALATEPAAEPKTYSPSLADSLPPGALLYLSTANLADPLATIDRLVARSNPGYATQKSQVETVLGLTLEGDIYPLISGEQAVAVYPAKPFPKVVFVTKVPEQERAKRLVNRLLSIARLGGLSVETFTIGRTSVSDITQAGSNVHGFVAVAGGRLIISSARDTLARLLRGRSPKLADDRLYRQARANADAPGKVVAMVYVDLAHGLPFAFDLAEANGEIVPPEARENTRPLKQALLYAIQDGNRFRVSGLLTIK
jgi:hypothetical protein